MGVTRASLSRITSANKVDSFLNGLIPLTATNWLALGGFGTTVKIQVLQVTSGGLGASYTNLTQQTYAVGGMSFSKSKAALLSTQSGFSGVEAYAWSAAGQGTKYTSPSGTGSCSSVAFSNSVVAPQVFVGDSLTPFVHGWSWSDASGFGTKYANPATLPSAGMNAIAINPSNNTILGIGANPPYINAYAFSASGFGTKYANPATAASQPAGNGRSCWTPSGNAIFTSVIPSSNQEAYAWSSGFGTKYAAPATAFTNTAATITINAAGTAVASNNGVYAWSASGWGTKYAGGPSFYGPVSFDSTGTLIFGCLTDNNVTSVVFNASTGFGTQQSIVPITVVGTGGQLVTHISLTL